MAARAARILFAGATGVLGRATLPHLGAHDVVGLTRSPEKAQLLGELGAEAAVCDVLDHAELLRLARRVRPQIVVNFVTDLASGSAAANNRARREGGRNLLTVALGTGASRLVVESVAFELDAEAREAVERLERGARSFTGEWLILRFGRLWGPGTFHEAQPAPHAVHVDRAGAEAARLIERAPAGTHLVA